MGPTTPIMANTVAGPSNEVALMFALFRRCTARITTKWPLDKNNTKQEN